MGKDDGGALAESLKKEIQKSRQADREDHGEILKAMSAILTDSRQIMKDTAEQNAASVQAVGQLSERVVAALTAMTGEFQKMRGAVDQSERDRQRIRRLEEKIATLTETVGGHERENRKYRLYLDLFGKIGAPVVTVLLGAAALYLFRSGGG